MIEPAISGPVIDMQEIHVVEATDRPYEAINFPLHDREAPNLVSLTTDRAFPMTMFSTMDRPVAVFDLH
jgi:hypothetical protein